MEIFFESFEKAQTDVFTKTIIDYKLSRYSCYLIFQNANFKFKNVALGLILQSKPENKYRANYKNYIKYMWRLRK